MMMMIKMLPNVTNLQFDIFCSNVNLLLNLFQILEMKPTISASNQNENYDYLHVQLRLKKLHVRITHVSLISEVALIEGSLV